MGGPAPSLFCGLPKQRHRMAVFVCGLDETAGRNTRDRFLMAGFVAPEEHWSSEIAPAWQSRVLDGPPLIPYLHMTEMRSSKWREEHGITKDEADARIDAAIDVIDKSQSLFPIGMNVDAGLVRDALRGMKIVHPAGGSAPLDPDYVCFLGYSYLVLLYVAQTYPDVEKVDFVIERNGRITKYIQAFHAGLSQALQSLDLPHAARLVGEILPAGKDRVPLQIADLLCWHTARARETMDELDSRRYAKLARRRGINESLTPEQIKELASSLTIL